MMQRLHEDRVIKESIENNDSKSFHPIMNSVTVLCNGNDPKVQIIKASFVDLIL